MNEEIKPCPLCGGKANRAIDFSLRDNNVGVVICGGCGSRSVGETLGEAIARWNRRITPENKQEGEYVRQLD
jgi:Lar family restriction alleviation protein